MYTKLTKAVEKEIRSLQKRKYRDARRHFAVEGTKMMRELARAQWPVHHLVASETWWGHNATHQVKAQNYWSASPRQLEMLSNLRTAPDVIAIVAMPHETPQLPAFQWAIGLEGIRDPGNMGALLRIADWYAVPQVIATPDTVEVFNPKVVQASMGSIFRVGVHYRAVEQWPNDTAWLGAHLEGKNAHQHAFAENGLLVIGSESHGLSSGMLQRVGATVAIPRFGKAESLNAAISAGILLDRLRAQHVPR